MNNPAAFLTDTVTQTVSVLGTIGEDDSRQKSAPDKWSFREIIGHLIDSAYNNRVRFINAQFKNDLIFDGYDQDGWVQFMNYQETGFCDLLERWKNINLELSELINRMPETKLLQKTANHNLDRVAFRKVPQGKEVNLSYFIMDYINHMRHHLNAIVPGMFEIPAA